jgi:hypothetical protein
MFSIVFDCFQPPLALPSPFGTGWVNPLQALLCDQKDLRDFVEVFEQWEIPLAKAPIQQIWRNYEKLTVLMGKTW